MILKVVAFFSITAVLASSPAFAERYALREKSTPVVSCSARTEGQFCPTRHRTVGVCDRGVDERTPICKLIVADAMCTPGAYCWLNEKTDEVGECVSVANYRDPFDDDSVCAPSPADGGGGAQKTKTQPSRWVWGRIGRVYRI